VKPQHEELMSILKSTTKWLSAPELAARMQVHPNKVRRLIASVEFIDVQKGIFDTGRPNGGKYIAVFKLVQKRKSHVADALELSKQHAGIWGQLMWSNEVKVDRIERCI